MNFPIDPTTPAGVRDEALFAVKKSSNNSFVALAAIADEILKSYGGSVEIKELQKKKLKIGVN